MRRGSLAVTLTVALATASCWGGEGPTGSSSDDPTGEWLLVEGILDDTPIELVPGSRVTMNFSPDGTVSGTSACNGYGGSYSVADGRLRIGEIGMDAAACEPRAIMEVEMAFHEAIRRPLTPIRDGRRLLLSGPGVAFTLEATTPVPSALLVGVEWVLESLVDDTAATPPAGEPATLLLTVDGSVLGSTGCRSLSGEYTIEADTVQFTTFTASGECPPALQDQDAHVVEVLGDGFTVGVEGNALTVDSAAGELGLAYRAQP